MKIATTVKGRDVEESRLVRALNYKVSTVDELGRELPDQHYRVYNVAKRSQHYCRTDDIDCDCGDFINRCEGMDMLCKHLIACFASEGNKDILEAMKQYAG